MYTLRRRKLRHGAHGRMATLRTNVGRWRGLVVMLALCVGCSSAFARAVEAGDSFALRGDWDAAAFHYERAARLDPEDEEATAKLREARSHQIELRIAMAEASLNDGHPELALAPLAEALKWQPSHPRASALYKEVRDKTMALANTELDKANAREALRLAELVVASNAKDGDAIAFAGKARKALAEQHRVRAVAERDKGNVEVGRVHACEARRLDATDAPTVALSDELARAATFRATYHVLLKNFDGDPKADDLGGSVGPSDLGRGFDGRYLVDFTDKPLPSKDKTLLGVRLGGEFRNYRYIRDKSILTHACRYVCGTDRIHNEAYDRAQTDLATAERDLDRSRRDRERAERVEREQQANADASSSRIAAASAVVREADRALSACRSIQAPPPAPPPDCSVLEAARSEAERAENEARSNAVNAERARDQARNEAERLRGVERNARATVDRSRQTALSTPKEISVDRTCDFPYTTERVDVRSEIELVLRGEALFESTAAITESVNGRLTASDESRPAIHGRCAELEQADPLTLPSDGNARVAVVDGALNGAQQRIIAAYERERANLLVSAEKFHSSGEKDAALGVLVRYELMRPDAKGPERKTSLTRIANASGTTEEAAKCSVTRPR